MAASASSYQITFVNEFASVTTLLQEKVANLIAINADINLAVAELGQCSYMAESIREILERIQGLVDRLNLENYANLERWVLDLDARIERVLMARLRDAIGLWVHEFSADRDASSSLAKGAQASGVEEAAGRRLATKRLLHSHKQRHAGEGATSSDTADGEDKPAAVRPKFHVLVHELCIRNQQMYLDPPIEHARSSWYSQLHAWMSVVCQQRRPQASRYELVNGDTPAAAAGPDGLADSDSDDYFHAKAERFFTAAPVG
ncbi:dynein heavy chain, partial [Spiromyces aspiralis]